MSETNRPDKMIEVKTTELRLGDMVDLYKGKYFRDKDDPEAPALIDDEYGIVSHIEREADDCIVVAFEGIGVAGYDPEDVFSIRKRETLPADWYSQFEE